MQHFKQFIRGAKAGRDEPKSASTHTHTHAAIKVTKPNTDANATQIQDQSSAVPVPKEVDIVQHNETKPQPDSTEDSNNATRSKPAAKYAGLNPRYKIEKRIGDGAFSVVYKAQDLNGEFPDGVAIKIIHKADLGNTQGEERLHPDFKQGRKAIERSNILKETAIQKRMDHENIVKLIEFHEDPDYIYMVLEYVPGGELFHRIVHLTYFSEELSRHVILQVAEAIRYMHTVQGVVHRDIKPENILFTSLPMKPSTVPRPKQPGDEGKVDEGDFILGVGAGGIGKIKIADFGLSKVIWSNDTKTPCGTAGYTAPEIVREDRYSRGVDMWALGCVLYTVLCGFPPFYDENLRTLSEKVQRGEYTFLSPWWDNISASAKDLITHLLVVDPEKRYTIEQFLAHPWMTQDQTPNASEHTPQFIARAKAGSAAFNPSNIIEDGRHFDPRSPDAINLREMFDISYDIARRVQTPFTGKNMKLGQVMEEDEEPESGESSDDQYDTTNGANAKVLEQGLRDTHIGDSQPRTNAQKANGYGQHSAEVAAAARRKAREQAQAGFELNFAGATLLNRRGHTPASAMGGVGNS
ncbi:MAPK-activated protein kinase Srk1 [Ceratocystis pirilliformis]|uniref:MAPK-activated protein kinase Srk1 n=1 Tax=Ceratocystis pirilliformis TaxID=259994 RepID=A0ABR3YFD4_9PEZI